MDLVNTTELGDATTKAEQLAQPSKFLTPMHGRGKELCDMLRKELGIPEGARSFDVRFAYDDIVTVRCEYMPRSQG